jgi:phosphoserine phosphatase
VQALEKRLEILNCTPADLQAFTAAYPPESRLTPGAVTLIQSLRARGVEVYLISGGFRYAFTTFSAVTIDNGASSNADSKQNEL